MIKIKKFTALVLTVVLTAGLFTGCTSTPEGKAIYDAMVREKHIKSSQSDMQYTFRLDATGLSEEEQSIFDSAKAGLNGARLTEKVKQVTNEDKTMLKSETTVSMSSTSASMDESVWVDMDLNAETPVFRQIVKRPGFMPDVNYSVGDREYRVIDYMKMMNQQEPQGQTPEAAFKDTMKTARDFEEKAEVFMSKYLAQYDPGFKFITDRGIMDISTPEGMAKLHFYQVKLDDRAVKQLIRYTVNNFYSNKDAMEFVAEYIKLVQNSSKLAAGAGRPEDELLRSMADARTAGLVSDNTEMLKKFNEAMDQLQDIKIIGDKGIMLDYGIDTNGFLVSQSGSMDFVLDMGKLDSMVSGEGEKSEMTGILYFGVDFNKVTYDINKDVAIQFPVLTPENSIDYFNQEDLEH